MAAKLSARKQKFVDAYAGNATEAAIAAGLSKKTAKAAGSRMFNDADVQAAIRARDKEAAKASIATRQQRQQFWTKVLLAENEKMADRLKASELLGRSEADFTDKMEVKGELTLEDLVRESADVPAAAVKKPVAVAPRAET